MLFRLFVLGSWIMHSLGNNVQIRVSGSACILLALMLLVLPLKWIGAALLAAALHEAFHAAAIILCGGRVQRLLLGSKGAAMEITPMTQGRELFCALSGPAGGLLLLLLAKWMPRTAICAVFHSFYNLLPVYPLDGGRALHCAAEMILHEKADRVCLWVENFSLVCIAALAVYACFILKLGLLPLLLAAGLWARKSPCKEQVLAVQ